MMWAYAFPEFFDIKMVRSTDFIVWDKKSYILYWGIHYTMIKM